MKFSCLIALTLVAVLLNAAAAVPSSVVSDEGNANVLIHQEISETGMPTPIMESETESEAPTESEIEDLGPIVVTGSPTAEPVATETPTPFPSTSPDSDVVQIEETATPTGIEAETETEIADGDVSGTGEDDEDVVCFPATSTVRLENGDRKAMKDVVLGDKVQCGPDMYCDVFMFGHRDADVQTKYLSVKTTGGNVLQASANHYIFANDRLVAAGALKVGDVLVSEDGSRQTIASITASVQGGAYNLHTTNGFVVVDGILASSYTTVCHPTLARLLLLPIRALYSTGVTTSVLEKSTPMLHLVAPRGPSVF